MSIQYVKGDSLFAKEDKKQKQYQYLDENITCDVLVIGGGVTGALVGYYLGKSNINTVIIDKGRIAHGSTSITTSLLQYELDSNAGELKESLEKEKIARAYELGLFAINEIEEFAKEYGNDFAFQRTDCLLYTSKKLETEEMVQEYKFRKEHGLKVELITQDENPFKFDVKAGVLSKQGGAVLDPYLFTHSLLEAGRKKGLRVYENTQAKKVTYEEDRVIVEASYGYKIQCKKIIVATGYHTDLFSKRNFGTKYTTFNIATKPVVDLKPIFKDVIFRDNKDPYHYFRATKDNRIIMGGEDVRFMPDIENKELCEKSYDKLETLLYSIFPKMGLEIDYKYCGAFATTKDNLGFVGVDPKQDKLWYCLGYGANGILFAVLGGYFLSQLYYGEINPDLSLFQVDRFDN